MRYLMVDRLTELNNDHSAVGLKNVTQSEDFFTDHFPGFPVMPGALTVEAMAQTAGRLICSSKDFKVRPMLLRIEKARFTKMIRPGDQMRIKVQLHGLGQRMAKVSAQVDVGEKSAARADLTFVLFPTDEQTFNPLHAPSEDSRRRKAQWLLELP